MPAVCEHCDDPFMARADSSRRYCSVLCSGRSRAGAKHHAFNGGLCFDTFMGRWVIHCRDGTLLRFARAVMAAELGRLLTPAEIVHHRDEDPTNDELGNLRVVTRAEHMRIHRAKIVEARRAA